MSGFQYKLLSNICIFVRLTAIFSNPYHVRHPVKLTGNTLVSIKVVAVRQAWMNDRLRTGKPPRHRTWHPHLFSLSRSSVGKRSE